MVIAGNRPTFEVCFALALICAAHLTAAATNVTLNAATGPTAADPSFTDVSVIGHGFPSGTILPASVTVTLTPTTPGSGPSGTATPNRVTVLGGSTEGIAFRVPWTIGLTAPTSYQVSIAGSTSTGAQFQSGNTAALTVNAPIAIGTVSPLPAGTVGVSYAQTLTATGGSGQYTWSVSSGALPAGLSLNSATGAIGGLPTTPATASFTILITDSLQGTASAPFSLTINPGPQLQSLSPNSANAGLSLQVSITGVGTHFVQGTTQANFGAGISVGGGPASGQPGPVTVNSPTSATAQISIGASAATGPRTVVVSTGSEQVSLTGGFTTEASIPYITVETASTTPLAPGFSGFADEYLLSAVECWDPKFLAMVQPMKPGFIRFPGGMPSMAFDWQAGFDNLTWINQLEPLLNNSYADSGLTNGQQTTQGKGGACFVGGTCVSDYATFLRTVGANAVIDFNSYTDTNPNSIGLMAAAAQSAGINVTGWELGDAPFVFPDVFATPAAYADAMYNPYFLDLTAADPKAVAAVFYQGPWTWRQGDYQAWDTGMSSYPNPYWTGVTFHMYAISKPKMDTVTEERTLNGVLAHGSTDFFNSYIVPLIGTKLPFFMTEMNTDGFATMAFESYIYNGIFLAEYIARMSTIPQIKGISIEALYFGNEFNQGLIRAVDDYQSYLKTQVQANPNFSTDTSTNPATQFQFYYSVSALAMAVANQAINSSNATWATTLHGGPSVPIDGYDGQPVPAIYAQGYRGTDGTHYVLITNKSGSSVPMAIVAGGGLVESPLTVSYISSPSDTAENTATAQTNVQIVTAGSPNPITVGPYSVTRVQW